MPVHGTRLFDLNYRTLAAITSTASFAPQAWKIIKTRETKDISTGMYSLTVAGFALWLAYGVMLGQWPLIATNGIFCCRHRRMVHRMPQPA